MHSNSNQQEWKEQVAKYPMDLKNMKYLYDSIDVIGVSGESLGLHAPSAIVHSGYTGVLPMRYMIECFGVRCELLL